AAAPAQVAHPIQVPGNWTRQGFDRPYYINVCMPFGDAPPKVPRDHNPCGVYRRNLLVREGFERVVLHFGGIESCGFIYVNGTCAGMVKDSRTSSEFDVTDFVHAGDNCLAVLVIRWSDGSFLEDQDHWRMAGIFRDVYLQYTPKAHIADVSVQTTLDEATESVGFLKLRLEAEFQGEQQIPSGWKFQLQLFDCEDGCALWDAPRELPFTEIDTMFLYPGTRLPYAEFSCEFPRIRRWSAETPHLYRLVVCLVAPDGTVAEATGTDLGFRSVRRKDGFLLINGQPVKFFGVNRHDFNERLGKTVTCEDIAADLQMMKRLNLNAIRTCHYPNDERLAALANRLGLYVISEANIECHAYREHLSGDPRWLPAMQERVGRMVQIYRNNPCIHLWSLGNEAGRGAIFHALAAWLRALDPSRGVHYGDLACLPDERLGTYTPHDGEALVDVVAPMYPTFAAIDNWLKHCMPVESRPFIPCEYSHAMGNSNGGLARYFEYFRKHPRCQGGYLWDWMDQGLAEIDENGRKYWTYGGDHGESVHDANFCINGLLLPDRTPHPVCHEVRFLARPFDFVAKKLSEGRFTLKNWHYFIPLDHLSFAWELQLDGRTVQSGELPPEVFRGLLPQHEREVLLAYDLGQLVHHPGQELFLTITARESAATAWAPADHLVAQRQFDLTECLPQVNSPLCPQIIGTAPPRALQFTTGGMPRQWRFNGKELLAGAIQEQFARGCVDNDGI
ncbi:MAG: DUF4981 domain-containing protein, partial [Victivallales bacterium]|nr:DUF4981 domain-containing protein [Victivallales bacterium]